MATLKHLLFTFISTCFLWQCATIQSPSGGNKDVLAPTVLSTSPTQGETNVRTKSIEIQFDEYYKLINLQNELLISPPLETKPILSQKGKKLFIEIQEDLNNNSTYTFNFGNGIADYHEGNVLKDYSLVFTTGEELDSLSISGNLNSCTTEILPENIIIGIYQKNKLEKDSTIYLKKPDYFTLLKENGSFLINHIRKGSFELVAFEDVNANYKYDGITEQIAFHDSIITVSDSNVVDLLLFKEEGQLKVLEARAKQNGQIYWALNKEVDSVEIHSSINTSYNYITKKDSIIIWPLLTKNDSAYFCIQLENLNDTIWVNKTNFTEPDNPKANLKNKFIHNNEGLCIQFSEPISHIENSKISIVKDSVYYDFEYSIMDFSIIIDAPFGGDSNYEVILEKGAVTSKLGLVNDSTNLTFYTKAKSAMAGLNINFKANYKNYFVELLKDGAVLAKLEKGQDLRFTELLPSKYQVRITIDSNADGKWTPGKYFENIQPEKVFYYKKEINLRANWEFEIDFNPED